MLESIGANPGQRIAELLMLLEAEHHFLLKKWNNTQREWGNGKRDGYVSLPSSHSPTLPLLFEAQVERMPDAVVVVFQDKQLTY